MSKKVLALNFGRINGMNRRFITIAIEAAKEAGAEVIRIDTANLNIGRCIGCGECSRSSREGGAATVECVLKDDFQMLREALLDSDAIIVAAPVYVLAPPGQYKNFLDRLGPANDYAATTKEAMKRRSQVPDPERPASFVRMDESGALPPLDPRVHKHRGIAYISLGGASVHHWVSLGIPHMKFLGFPIGAHLIDEMDIHGLKKIFTDKDYAAGLEKRAAQLGRNVAEAAGRHPRDVQFKGDDPGICPMCHCRFISLSSKGTKIECPICGISGSLSIEDGALKVNFPVDEWDNSRFAFQGLIEHTNYGTLIDPHRQAHSSV